MRKLILILILGLLSLQESESQWKRLLPEKTYGFAVNPKNPKSIYVGGTKRRIFHSYDAGNTWDTLVVEFQNSNPTPLQTNIFIHPIDTNILLTAGINFGVISRSTDGGKKWSTSLEGKYPIAMSSEAIISDAINPEIIYAAESKSTNLYRSLNRGVSWDSIGFIKLSYLCTITMIPHTTTMFASSGFGYIKKSTDTGKTWRIVAEITNGIFNSEIPTLVFSKRNPDVGYAVSSYSNYKDIPNGGLYKTVDGGEKWNKIGFADTSLWSVAVRTVGNQDEVYVGGYAESIFPERFIAGQDIVSRSPNSGASWERIDNSIDWSDTIHHNVWMMKFVEDTPLNEKLYMATEAGFFVMDVPVSVQENEPFPVISDDWNAKLANGTLTVFPPKNINSNSEYTVRLYTLVGEKIAEQTTTGSKELFVGTCGRCMYLCQITSGQSRKNILLVSQ